MDDDFNTAQAMATLFDLAREINRADESGLDASQARETLRGLGGVLGLTFEEPPLDVKYIARVYTAVYQELGRVPACSNKSDGTRWTRTTFEDDRGSEGSIESESQDKRDSSLSSR